MLNPELLKEIVNFLITNPQAINKFNGKLNKEFFEAVPALECCVDLVHKHYIETKTLMSNGELIRAIDILGVKNKQIKNMIDEPVDLINDIMNHNRYDTESLTEVIIKEIESAKIIETTNSIVDSLNTKGLKSDEIMDSYGRISADIKDLSFDYSRNELDFDFNELMDSFENAKEQGNIINTGFPILDSHQLGLTRNGEVGIIVAPPNRGKTAFLLAMARNMVALGYNILFITGETHVDDLKKRFWSGIFNTAINTLGSTDRNYARKAFVGMSRIGGSLQWHSFVEKPAFTPTDLDFIINKYREQRGRVIDVIFLDYFDLMLPDKSTDKDALRAQINKIYRSVRRISVKYGIPIWTASQTNREGADLLLITEKNIGEDWQKICNADKAISFNQTLYEAANKTARLFVMKTRNSTGKNSVIQIKTDFERMTFQETKEMSFKEHMKFMVTLEHENRRNKFDDKKFEKRTNRLG